MNYKLINTLVKEHADGASWDDLGLIMDQLTNEEIRYAEGIVGVANCFLDENE
jgi:hypothetical protein